MIEEKERIGGSRMYYYKNVQLEWNFFLNHGRRNFSTICWIEQNMELNYDEFEC